MSESDTMRRMRIVLLPLLVLVLHGAIFVVFAQGERDFPAITPDNAAQVTLLAEIQGSQRFVWAPDANTIAFILPEGIYRRDLRDLSAIPAVIDGAFVTLAYRDDGRLIALEHEDANLIPLTGGVFDVIDVLSGGRLARLNIESEYVTSPVFSPDGSLIAFGDDSNRIQLWNITTGALVGTLEGHHVAPSMLMFSPDGNLLASGGCAGDDRSFLWDISTLSLLRDISGQEDACVAAFSLDGRWLATGNNDLDTSIPLVLWDLPTLIAQQPALPIGEDAEGRLALEGYYLGSVLDVAFNPAGTLLASAGVDIGPPDNPTNAVRLWNVETGEKLAELTFPDLVTRVSFSPDGALLATAGYGDVIQIWGIAEGE